MKRALQPVFLFLFVLASLQLTAQDTVFVQTLSFDSITTRRGIFEFPDNGDTYRKILMYYTLKCDQATTADGFPCGEWDYLTYNFIYDHTGVFDTAGNEIIERYEIGRFITPYGIGLNLDAHGFNPGPNGFTWVYDVTDYAHLLKGDVDFSAGNNQELIDVRFAMIKGTPPRDVKKLNRIWGTMGTYSYGALDNDDQLSETEIQLEPDATQFMVKTRLTGHGHNSSSGGYPHCCEWKNNTHFFYVDGIPVDAWEIWQTNDCALNPVYPQGGTWPGAREGWCPGDRVKDHEINITDFVTGPTAKLDYSITPVPANNPGMAGGNYRMAMQLFQYGPNNFDTDVEVYDIITPSKKDEYSRMNPICRNARVMIRNNGNEVVTSVDFTYGSVGGIPSEFTWSGVIGPHQYATVTLPIDNESFWLGDGSNQFYVTVSSPNGETDQYSDNNTMTTEYVLPQIIDGSNTLIFVFNTNSRPDETSYYIRDIQGNLLHSRTDSENLWANSTYEDEIEFESGKCYSLQIIDKGNDGLSYWADPNAGSGSFLIRKKLTPAGGPVVRSFESEFGREINYTFSIGELTNVSETELPDASMLIQPNPSQGIFTAYLDQLAGPASLEVLNNLGQRVRYIERNLLAYDTEVIDLTNQPDGIYLVQIQTEKGFLTKRVVKSAH